jgi:hypothetical protein
MPPTRKVNLRCIWAHCEAVLTANLGGVFGPIEVGDPQIKFLGIARRTVGFEVILQTKLPE